jgi:hypothetical protein
MKSGRKIAIITNIKRGELKLPINLNTFGWSDLTEEINFRDYDGLIIDVSELPNNVDWVIFYRILNRKICIDMLKAGGYIIVLGDASFDCIHGGIPRHFMNWSPFNIEWVVGSGTSFKQTEQGNKSKFARYLDRVEGYASSFNSVDAHRDLASPKSGHKVIARWQVFSINRTGYAIGAMLTLKLQRGYDVSDWLDNNFFMLPSTNRGSQYDIVDLVSIFENNERASKSEPDWAKIITVAGQEGIDTEIANKQELTRLIKEDLVNLENNKSELRKPLEILYKSDKPLEEAVKNVFRSLGGNVIEPKETNKIEFHLSYNDLYFAPEVKSTAKSHIEQKGLRQAIDWSNDAYDETQRQHKALLIVSAQYQHTL